MKFLVDEMPYFQDDCPFFEGAVCILDGEDCEYMVEHEARHRPEHENECRWLCHKDEVECK